MKNAGRQNFFDCPSLDRDLPLVNKYFWSSLIEHIERDQNDSAQVILDIGCHSGGLLHALHDRFASKELLGIEPLAAMRNAALECLRDTGAKVAILDTTEWPQIPDGHINIVTSHEVLYLEPDLQYLMKQIRRVLADTGVAYAVLGCHSENPLWEIWKKELVRTGNEVYDHKPLDIMRTASLAGLLPSVQPLRSSGWITYDPLQAEFQYPDIKTMFEHHYRYKLIFRFHVANDFTKAS